MLSWSAWAPLTFQIRLTELAASFMVVIVTPRRIAA